VITGFEAKGNDPGVKLRHLSQIRHATCTGPVCRRPSTQADFEHNIPYEAGGRTCMGNGGPKCRHDHRLKQHPRWNVEQLPDGGLPPALADPDRLTQVLMNLVRNAVTYTPEGGLVSIEAALDPVQPPD